MSDEAREALTEHREALAALSAAMWRSVIPARFWDAKLDWLEPALRSELADWASIDSGANVVLLGPVGAGKTYAAIAAARARHEHGQTVMFCPVVRLLDQLRPDGNGPSVDELCAVDVLILDDLAGEKPTDWTKERLDLVVNDRWLEGRPTVVTTNLPLEILMRVLDERLYSRLIGDAVVLRVSGRDRRRS